MEDIMVALTHARRIADSHDIKSVSLAALGVVRRIAAAVAREVRLRRDLASLRSFDDAMLHDIGLSRGEIESAVREGRLLGAWVERR
jgi:uncharacterized protein YjiS (DUF1127 family)